MVEEIKTLDFERISLKNRLHFQLVLMKMMLGENSTHELQNEWAEKYGVRVSSIIDDTKNAFIRDLIMKDNSEGYIEASKILVGILNNREDIAA
jgi:hypothetical protein